MTIIFLFIIVLVSLWGFQNNIPFEIILSAYALLAILPAMLIIIKKNLFYALLLWFFLLLFKYGFGEYGSGTLKLPLLPDVYAERLLWFCLISVFIFGVTMRQIPIDVGITIVEVMMIFMCIYVTLSMVIAGNLYVEGHGLYIRPILTVFLIPYLTFFLAKYIVVDEQKIKKVFIFFAIIGFYLGITGIFEHYSLNQFVYPSYITDPYVGIHWGRARGPYLSANSNGWNLGMIFFMTLYLLLHSKKKWTKIFLRISLAVMLISLLFTLTRSAWLGVTLASFLIPVFFKQARKAYIGCILLAIVLIITQFSVDQFKLQKEKKVFHQKDALLKDQLVDRAMSSTPIYGRIALYKLSLAMFLDRPFLGVGYKMFHKYNNEYIFKMDDARVGTGVNLHDGMVKILVELGLVGLSCYLFIIVYMFITAIRLYKLLPPEKFIGKGIAIVFIQMLIVSNVIIQFGQLSYSMFQLSLLYLMAGVIVGHYQRNSQTKMIEEPDLRVENSEGNIQMGKKVEANVYETN